MSDVTNSDFQAHEHTYKGFIRLGRWVVGVLAVVLICLYFIVQP